MARVMKRVAEVSSREEKKTTAQRLVEAAEKEFREFGYSGTNTNQIASRAGFAPQTFYRHFGDKLEVFFAVYETWTQKEIDLLEHSDDPEEIADIIIAHHNVYRVFRRDLRRLTVENEAVANMRVTSRKRHLEVISRRNPAVDAIGWPQRAARLLTTERVADAIAEGEFAKMGVSAEEGRALLVSELRILLGKPEATPAQRASRAPRRGNR